MRLAPPPPSRPATRVLAAIAFVGLTAATVACSSTDGRELAEPDPDLTLTTPPTTAPPTTLAPVLSMKSPAFAADGVLPERFTCDGVDVSPPLSIEAVPADAEELAIAFTDPDAGGFVHWAVIGIDPAIGTIDAGQLPAGAIEYPNDFGDASYGGPCPPDGATHTFEFTVYAVPATAVDFVGPDQTNGAGIIDAVSRLSSASAGLSVTYGR